MPVSRVSCQLASGSRGGGTGGTCAPLFAQPRMFCQCLASTPIKGHGRAHSRSRGKQAGHGPRPLCLIFLGTERASILYLVPLGIVSMERASIVG